MARSASILEQLVLQAKNTFCRPKNDKPSPQDIDKLKKIMSQLTADDLNLNPEMIRRSWDFPPYVKDAPAAFMDIYECKQFSITIFMLKANKNMPLHNHPGMFGLMKILRGSMVINSYNKLDTSHRSKPPYPTHLTTTIVATPSSDPCYLQPETDNIHELQAQSDHVAFLDILAPPYDPNEGRDCTYYTKVPPPAEDQNVDKYVWLLPGKNPSWFSCVPQHYSGPKVQ